MGQVPGSTSRRVHEPRECDVDRQPGFSVDKMSSPCRRLLFGCGLHRALILLFVFFLRHRGSSSGHPALEAGVDRQLFLLGSPGLRAFVSNGFVRGLCSGLGLLDIWIGFWKQFTSTTKNRTDGKTTSS